MKTVDEYMSLAYRMELTPDLDEGGYVVSYPDLTGCLSCGETTEETIKNAENARCEWLIAAMEAGIEIPLPSTAQDYSGQFKLLIPKTLHRLLELNAKHESVSLNQWSLDLIKALAI